MLTLRTKRETNRIPLVRAGGFKLDIQNLIPDCMLIPLVRAGGFKLLPAQGMPLRIQIPLVRAGGFKHICDGLFEWSF